MSCATTVRCPHCDAKLRVKSRRLDGKELSCPRCTQRILLERVAGTSDYIAVLFFRGHDDRWATTIQPANRESDSAAHRKAAPANTASEKTTSDRPGSRRQWRWPVTYRTTAVVLSLSLLFCVMLGGYSVVGNEYRTWRTADGRRSKIKLAYVTHDESTVRFKRQDNGREIRMPLASLSLEDRRRLGQFENPSRPRAAGLERKEPRKPPGAGTSLPGPQASDAQSASSQTNPVDWPMWRGSSRDGVVSAGPTLLTSWPGGGPRQLWTSDRIPGEWEGGWGSVSIADGKAYTYVNIPPNKRRPQAYSGLDVVYCLNAETGKEIWKFENDGGTHTTPSNSTPCIVGGRCYAAGSGGYVYCLDARTGREIWQAQTSRPSKETSSSFVVADGVAVVLSGPVTGLDAASGEELWSHDRLRSNHSSAAIWKNGDRAVAICSTDRQLVGIDVKTGEIAWQVRLEGSNSTPVVAGNHVVVHARHEMAAYRLSDSQPEKLWSLGGGCHGSTPVVYGGFVYATGAGRARCVRLADGGQMWNEGIGNSNYSSPIVADRKLLTVGKSRLLMFGTNSEQLERLDEQPLGLVECTSPTIADGKLYLRLKQNVVCYDLRT